LNWSKRGQYTAYAIQVIPPFSSFDSPVTFTTSRQTYEKITSLTRGRIHWGENYARIFYQLGKITEQQGDKLRARQNYTKFLDLKKDADPGLPEVEDAKKRLAGLKCS
jgi:hypothetical protein